MLTPFRSAFALFSLSSVLLGSCSSPQESTLTAGSAETAATPVAMVRSPGTRADSLAGIPGHAFGQALSEFPGLALYPSQNPGGKTYYSPGGKGEPGWFGKRKKESPTEFFSTYVFKDGRFVAFQAMAVGPGREALRAQTRYLLGAGTQTTTTTNWEGKQVFAFYSEQYRSDLGPTEQLDVQSQDFTKALAKGVADKFKQENAL